MELPERERTRHLDEGDVDDGDDGERGVVLPLPPL